MKMLNRLSNALLSLMAFAFVFVATVSANSYCFTLWGEPECPQCLQKH